MPNCIGCNALSILCDKRNINEFTLLAFILYYASLYYINYLFFCHSHSYQRLYGTSYLMNLYIMGFCFSVTVMNLFDRNMLPHIYSQSFAVAVEFGKFCRMHSILLFKNVPLKLESTIKEVEITFQQHFP